MSALRTILSRSALPSTRRLAAPSPAASQLVRNFLKPSSPVLKAEDEEKARLEYEKHRQNVDPKMASVDESLTFEHPKTSEWKAGDPGHDVVGAGHGRHNKRTLSSLSMDGKVCVVTGAARGLGNMMARTFVESGASSIAIVDLNEADARAAAKDLEEWFVTHGEAEPGEIKAKGYGCDVANEQSVTKTFDAIEKDYGSKIDCLVTAAGIVENFIATEYPTEKVRKLLDINVMGSWFCALQAKKRMPEGGSIILIGSMSGNIVNAPQPQTPYNFSKAAVRHMASSLAVEWAKDNIRVNCVAPGYTLTNLTKVILDANPVLRDEWLHRIPMGRLADPSDLKGAIVLLASDSSKYITGSQITIDGGYTCL
ncbi:putative d-arabinitol 2-dehydrogenase [Kockovaella imperatae]|uniref:Putative d-arabinitol 2-dehydrogenase n=1 Tax=Kockovaella imperatae TaxID=4999 RepID=A0A1Y1UBK5_9TREE|nr:putative d-arabinitol 2-dehydrogenase [Kockovaella imperatae]ORX35438.1 putative d-arabinitol 2-dehydrogenase [Kockovaella imperatae]